MACILLVATFAHLITPWLLLLLTFALSIGDAVESPAWRAHPACSSEHQVLAFRDVEILA